MLSLLFGAFGCDPFLGPGSITGGHPVFITPVHGVQISCFPVFRSPAARRSDLLQPAVEISWLSNVQISNCPAFRSPYIRRWNLLLPYVQISYTARQSDPLLLPGVQISGCPFGALARVRLSTFIRCMGTVGPPSGPMDSGPPPPPPHPDIYI